MIIDLSSYIENINTECMGDLERTLKIKAIKIDAKGGLKDKLSCAGLKSCDYIKEQKDKLILLEISDISAEYKALSKEYSKLTKPKLKKMFDPKKQIAQDFKYKYIGTLIILYKLEKKADFDIDKDKNYFIAMCSKSKDEIKAFDIMRRNIKNNLQGLVDKVKVIPVLELDNILCQE